MKCIILVGGFATRLWPLSENKAKPLLHLKDRPILSHIVDSIPQDIPIILDTNATFEKDFSRWAEQYPNRDIRIFVEDSSANATKRGALGAVALAIQKLGIDEDLLLIAGDNYFGFRISDFIIAFKGHPILAAYDMGDPKRLARTYGVVVEKNGVIQEFQEKPAEPKSSLASTGCYLFPRKNLADIVEYAQRKKDDLGGIFIHLLEKGEEVNAFSFKEPWYDIGSFDGYLRANRELIGDQVIEKGTVTKTGRNTFLGGVFLGENSVIENSVIENSVILQNCAIQNCVLRNCIIDEGCTLAGIDLNRQMIRRGSVIKKTNGGPN